MFLSINHPPSYQSDWELVNFIKTSISLQEYAGYYKKVSKTKLISQKIVMLFCRVVLWNSSLRRKRYMVQNRVWLILLEKNACIHDQKS